MILSSTLHQSARQRSIVAAAARRLTFGRAAQRRCSRRRPGGAGRRAPVAALVAVAVAVVVTAAAPPPARAIVLGRAVPAGAIEGAPLARISSTRLACSGALVARRLVVLALHCLQPASDPADPSVGLEGRVAIGNPNGGGLVVDRHVVSVLTPTPPSAPPDATGGELDIAGLVLDRAVSSPPVSLPASPAAATLLAPGSPAVVVGFGADTSPPPAALSRTSGLREAALSITDCGVLPSPLPSSPYVGCAVPAAAPILGSIPPGSACEGDSGGPVLAVEPHATPVLVGIVSRGQSGCPVGGGNVFTSVAGTQAALQTLLTTPLPPPSPVPPQCRRDRHRLARLGRRLSIERRATPRRGRAHRQLIRDVTGRARLAVAVYEHC